MRISDWSSDVCSSDLMLVVTLKYVMILMRADNKGEGGSLALLALISRSGSGGSGGKRRWTAGIVLLGVFACALFYGDSMITPAISVLGAVEGLMVIETSLRSEERRVGKGCGSRCKSRWAP